MKNKKDRDYIIAAALIVAYESTLTFAALDHNGALSVMATLVFATIVYSCYRIDRADKHRARLRAEISAKRNAELAALEHAREMKEAD